MSEVTWFLAGVMTTLGAIWILIVCTRAETVFYHGAMLTGSPEDIEKIRRCVPDPENVKEMPKPEA